MRILVTGASGLLGLNLSLLMHEKHHIIGVDRSKLAHVPFSLVTSDLLDPGALQPLLDETQPEALIHCAANADVDSCEADPIGVQRLNTDLPAQLARLCAAREIRMIHMSTDAVFDGVSEYIYTEEDQPNPLGVYAQSKLKSEQAVLAENGQAIVARVNFFGWSLSGTRSLAEFFHNRLSVGQSANGFTDVTFCPLFVADLAELLIAMLEARLGGLYHVVGSEALTKYQFGVRVAQQFGFDPSLIVPISVEDSGLQARRSRNLHLSAHKLSTDLGAVIPGVSTGLAGFYTQYQQGYPQKMRSYTQV